MGCNQSTEATAQAGGQQQGQGTTAPDDNKNAPGPAKDASAFSKATHAPAIAVQKIGKEIGAKANHHVRNIFATPFEMMDLATYRPPVHDRTEAETRLIENALKSNFVFEQMSPKELKPLVKAFDLQQVQAGTVIIQQGDVGDYFYIIQSGTCAFIVNEQEVGKAERGKSFGELALLYNCPRAATVKAITDSELFRVDQKTFRYILQAQTKEGNKEKIDLLSGVDFLKDLGDTEVTKLVDVMTPKRFTKGEYLMHKGDEADNFYIFQEGKVKICNISVGNVKYEDVEVGPGGYGGERAIITGEKRAADMVALTDGLAFVIDKGTFASVFGNLKDVVSRSLDKQRLSSIKLFIDSELDDRTIRSIAGLIKDKKYPAGFTITKAGQPSEAALYIIRSGKVEKKEANGTSTILEDGAYTGVEALTHDVKTGKISKKDSTAVVASETLIAAEECVCGVLTLRSMRTVINTAYLGTGNKDLIAHAAQCNIELNDLKRHTILGAGTFGQVWLVSATSKNTGEKNAYALKVQSKFELIQDGQAKAVAYEKSIMSKLNHPFIIRLVNSYKDENFVYMLLQLVQGGELYSIIHGPMKHGVPENQARFYAAGVCDGLAYMHKRGYVYRDLKPENILIDSDGYPVIIDFGFAKFVKDKTYTLCGTPLYLAPEVILNRGHNWGADHFSVGVLIYEMLTGDTPFYKDGMEQMDLFRAIVKCKYDIPKGVPPEAASIIHGLVKKDMSLRLGNLAGGEDDILDHHWFSSIDFESLRHKEIKAPFVPKIKNPLDASNFDDWSHLDDKTKQKFPRLRPEQEHIFDDF